MISAGGRSSFEKVSACPCRKFKNGFTPARDRARSPATGDDCIWSSTGSAAAFWLASTASNSTAFLCRLGETPFRAHGRHPPFGHFGLHKVDRPVRRERERDRVSEQLAADRQVTNTHQGFFVVGQKNEEDARSPFCCVALHTTAWRTLGVRIDASIFTGIVYSSPRGRSVGAVLPRMKLNEIKYDNVLHGERRG